MRDAALRGGLLALALAGGVSACWAGEKEDAERIARLVGQLGSEVYREREAAMKALEGEGIAALAALRPARASADEEIGRRARDLVARIERRLDGQQVLAPRRIKLNYRDVPLEAALLDLSRKTGFPITLDSTAGKAAERTVSLQTEEISFWEAIDQFNLAAGVRDKSVSPADRSSGNMTQIIIINGNIFVPQQIGRDGEEADDRLVLLDGKGPALPTHYCGALRIRALPPGTGIAGERVLTGQAVLGLEVTPEPGLTWQKTVGVRLTRAIDDEGQSLEQVILATAEAPPSYRTSRGMIVVNGMVLDREPTSSASARQVPVRVKQGAKPAKTLTELSGLIVGLVQTPPQPLVRVNNVLDAVGQTVAGGFGGSVKVLEAERGESGEVRVKVQVKAPVSDLGDSTTAEVRGNVIVNGRVISGGSPEPPGTSFALLDAGGKPLTLTQTEEPILRPSGVREYQLVFVPEKGQGNPVQFVYTGRRSAVIDVPFTLKDVPLP
jgi:hypothetical protein